MESGDGYAFAAAEQDVLVITTATPFPLSPPDLRLELYNPQGLLVAVDDNSAADGVNAQVTYVVPAGGAGIYTAVVIGDGGSYTVQVAGATPAQGSAATVTATSLPDGTNRPVAPTTLELSFSAPVRLDTLEAGDLTLTGGGVATAVEILDGRTVRFTLDLPDVEGGYAYTLAEGAVLDLAGRGVPAFTAGFTIDRTGPRIVQQQPATQGSAPFSSLTFVFDEPIDPSTFTTADVFSFTGPGGVNLGSAITGVSGTGDTYTVTFNPQSARGVYTLVIGPNIADVSGNLMDQDGDGIGGEVPDDRYVASVDVQSPDLSVTAATAPAAGTLGQTLAVSWTVTNLGTDPAVEGWSDRVYLSTDPVFDAGDRLLGTYAATSVPLAAGGSYTRNENVTIPLDLTLPAGTWYVLVRTDALGTQPESNEANNVRATAAVSLERPALPDLVVSSIVVPSSAISGRQVQLTWTLTNAGTADAVGTWEDRVWLSDDAVIGSDSFLGDFAFTGVVPAGQSVSRTQAVTLPATLSGNRWVVVRTDVRDTIEEFDAEQNNTAISTSPIDVVLQPLPNLQVTDVRAPATAFSSQKAVVEWTVTNTGTGSTNTPSWIDRVYLSTDAVFDAGDMLLGSATNPSFLAAGDSYVSQLEVTMPQGISGPRWFIIVADGANQVFEFTNEDDNSAVGGPTIVSLTPPPDLQVADVNTPQTVFSGQPMLVSWTVLNAGTGRTLQTNWRDRIYLSTDETLDAGDIVLADRNRSGALEGGESYRVQDFPVTLPIGVAGTFFVIVETDQANQVFEDIFEDNNVTARTTPVQVVLTPPPDLEVDVVTVPATVGAGRDLTINYEVTNYGPTATPNSSWTDAFYLSNAPTLDTATALKLGERNRFGVLDPLESESRQATFTLPIDLTGQWYAFVVSDAKDVVFEVDNANNTGRSASAMSVIIDRPDLVVPAAPTVPTQVRAGEGFTVSFGVQNVGAGATYAGSWQDAVFLSPDVVIGNGNDVQVANITRSAAVPAGGGYAVAGLNAVVPADLPPGQYFVFIRTDANGRQTETLAGEANNVSPLATLEVLPPAGSNPPGGGEPGTGVLPDLVASNVVAPAAAASGQPITVTWRVDNIGVAATTSNYWSDSVYLSPDGTVGGGAVLLGSVQRNGNLATGTGYDAAGTFTLPIDLSGTWTVVVRADANNRVSETGPAANNDAAAPATTSIALSPVADLAVTNVDAPPTAFSGRTLTLSWTVQNQGGADAVGTGGSWFDNVYLSLDQVFDKATDVSLGAVRRDGTLAAGDSYTATGTVNVPEGLAGPYYVFVVADSTNRVYERTATLNNTGFDAGVTNVELTPPADLVVGTITVPVNGVPGQDATITYTVRNEGQNAARGTWSDSIYLSADETWDINDPLFARVTRSGDVPAGGSYSQTVTAALPGVLPGEYRVIIRSDIRNNIAEIDETNNVSASLDSVTLDAEQLTLEVTESDTLSTGRTAYYRIDVAAGQTLLLELNAADPQAFMELFVARGRVPSRTDSDFASVEPFSAAQRVVVPITAAGTYYVAARAADVPAGSTAFDLTARLVDFEIFGATPGTVANAGRVTLAVEGAKFDLGTRFQVIDAGGNVLATSIDVLVADSSRAEATFDLAGVAPGGYGLRAVKTGGVAQLADAFTVANVAGGRFVATLDGPASVRPGRLNTFQLTYGNSGGGDVATPLLVLASPTGTPFGLAGEGRAPGELLLLATPDSGFTDRLKPGTSVKLPMAFQSSTTTIDIRLQVATVDDPTPLDVARFIETLRPASTPAGVWAHQRDAYVANLGGASATLGDFVKQLNATAARLAAQGTPARDARALVFAELESLRPDAFAAVAGQVVDLATGTPLAGEQIIAVPQVAAGEPARDRTVARTDAAGRFAFFDLAPGTYELKVSGKALAAVEQFVEVGTGQRLDGLLLRAADRWYDPTVPTVPTAVEAPVSTPADRRAFRAEAGQRRLAGVDGLVGIEQNQPAAGDHGAALSASKDSYNSGPPQNLDPSLTLQTRLDGTNGFQASVYTDSNGDIVIAFRGTSADGFNAPIADAYADLGLVLPQWDPARGGNREMVFNEIARQLAQNPNAQVISTGHSLGGGLAQMFVYDALAEGFLTPDQIGRLETFNGVGVRDGIIERDGSYNPNTVAGVPNNHFSINGDLVSRLGGGHVGDQQPFLLGPEQPWLPAHLAPALDAALAAGLLANPDGQFTGGEYLDIETQRLFIQAVAEFGNYDPVNTELESAFRVIAGLAQIKELSNAQLRPLVEFFADNIEATTPGAFGQNAADLIRNTNWARVIDGVDAALTLLPFLPNLDQISAGALIAAFVTEQGAFVAGEVMEFFGNLPDRLGDFAQGLANAASATANGLWDLATWDFDDIPGRFNDLVDGWAQALDGAAGLGLDLFDLASDLADRAVGVGADLIGDLATLVGSYVDLKLDALDRAVRDAIDRAAELADAAMDRARDAADAVDNFVDDLLDDLGDFFRNPFGLFNPPVIFPVDPNDILGPEGFGPQRFIAAGAPIGYTIRFENDPEFATAPAQVVRIEQTLDSDLDPRTFRLGDFGFGEWRFSVPNNSPFFASRLDLTGEIGYFVDVAAGIDTVTGVAFWQFSTIDPATGELPADALAGFLPVNLTGPEGEGFVTYEVRPDRNVASGAVIDALATIIFDTEAPLDTPPIFNTIDAGVPTSLVDPLPAEVPLPTFDVTWSGADDAAGAGLAGFDVFVSADGGPFVLWLENTQLTGAPYPGTPGVTYSFYSVARDNAGNVEAAPATPDAVTRVFNPNSPPTIDAGPDAVASEGVAFTRTGTVTDPDSGETFTATVDYGEGAGPVPLTINPDGTFTLNHVWADDGVYTVLVEVEDSAGNFAADSFAVTVDNVAPTAVFTGPSSVNEGDSAAISFSDAFDVAADLADGLTYSFDFDGDGVFEVVGATTPGLTLPGSFFADGPATRRVVGRVSDADGGFTDYTLDINVNNVDPTITLAGDTVTLPLGGTLSAAGSFFDPGADTHAATIDYGDGTGPVPLALNADGTFTLNHTYTTAGTFAVVVTVTDDDGGVGTAGFTVEVVAPPAVSALVINDGSPQRSMVATLSVVFAAGVTLSADAFVLDRAAGGSVAVVATNPSGDGVTWLLTPQAGPLFDGNSLADGVYTLRVTAGGVTNGLGQPMAEDYVAGFHRFFGDSDGDGDVDAVDLGRFGQAFGKTAGQAGYQAYFDSDGDGDVDAIDLGRFRSNFGRSILA